MDDISDKFLNFSARGGHIVTQDGFGGGSFTAAAMTGKI